MQTIYYQDENPNSKRSAIECLRKIVQIQVKLIDYGVFGAQSKHF